ncbi:fatty acid desaturase [Acidaminobacter sp. JC074]|uniref:fatty acid desaturase n=1 Tax=Acidaminobacter sp. JC074 TaxID=2530199 RepID=UPI001F0EE95F|nr:fatty acid desaturase [Acidaminobacter sp. JC074]MCH4887779.1 fatty acid desaturase [Acidaminobacter sp. JC074]
MKRSEWRERLAPFTQASTFRSWMQIVNTLVPYILLVVIAGLMIRFEIPYIFTFLVTFLAGAFMVRVFIIFHDCTHMSFFTSRRANRVLGTILGIITFTPYAIWQKHHNKHHGTVGNLDERGVGDVWTMTVEEYLSSSRFKKFTYRLYRNPIFLFVIAPFFLFAFVNRFPKARFESKKLYMSHLITNLGLLLIFLLVTFTIGIKYYLLIQIPLLFFASAIGVWMFFIQHQFEDVYWERDEDWDIVKAALKGSSFYKLPWILDWITGHIGYHNIHHLNPRIPNYYLKKCYRQVHEFKKGRTITLFESFKMAMLSVYDEKSKKLISYKELRRLKASMK